MSVHLENRWVLSYDKTIESKDFYDVNDCTKTPTHSWQRFHVSHTFSSFFLNFFCDLLLSSATASHDQLCFDGYDYYYLA